MRSLPLLLLLVFVASGCVSTNHTMLGSKTYAPLDPSQVVIYLSQEDIPGSFERVALINASGSTQYTNEQQMYNAVRKRAASIGANGVLIGEIDEPGTGAKIAGAIFGVSTNRKSQMLAIYVLNVQDVSATSDTTREAAAEPTEAAAGQ